MFAYVPRNVLPLIAFAAALFLPSLGFGFAYDDYYQILYNPVVSGAVATLRSVFVPFSSPTFPGDLYRPLTVATYVLNYLVAGEDPATYHAVNVLLHVGCSAAVFAVARAMSSGKSVALFAALLFAAHPIHVEAVANICGRAELLAALFALLCFLFATVYFKGGAFSSAAACSLCFLCGVLAKESALTILPMVLLTGINRYRASRKKILLLVTCLALTSVAALALRLYVLGVNAAPHGTLDFHSENPLLNARYTDRIIPSLALFGAYIQIFLFPAHLSGDYSMPFSAFWREIGSARGIATVVLGVCFLTSACFVKNSNVRFWAIWTAATMTLTINLLFPIGTIMAERLFYLPSVGACIMLSELFQAVASRVKLGSQLRAAAAAVIVLALAFRTEMRMPVWKDNLTLFSSMIRDNPESPKANFNLGQYYFQHEKDAATAHPLFLRSLDLDPSNVAAAKYLVETFIAKGDVFHARTLAQKIVERNPSDEKMRARLQEIEAALKDPQPAGR